MVSNPASLSHCSSCSHSVDWRRHIFLRISDVRETLSSKMDILVYNESLVSNRFYSCEHFPKSLQTADQISLLYSIFNP